MSKRLKKMTVILLAAALAAGPSGVSVLAEESGADHAAAQAEAEAAAAAQAEAEAAAAAEAEAAAAAQAEAEAAAAAQAEAEAAAAQAEAEAAAAAQAEAEAAAAAQAEAEAAAAAQAEAEAAAEAQAEAEAAAAAQAEAEAAAAAQAEAEAAAQAEAEAATEAAAQTQTWSSAGTGTASYYSGTASAGAEDSSLANRIYNVVRYANQRMNLGLSVTEFSRYIFIGDSRTVGMHAAVGGSAEDCWACKESMGYNWMVSEGIPAVESAITENTAVFILLGINDLGNVNSYVSYINSKTLEWEARGAETFFVAVGPVGQTTVTNAQIESFNNTVKANTCAIYIDLYSAMLNNGFSTQDGLHYTAETYSFIYNYLKEQAVALASVS